jgi:arabinofuranan 3-O-arabinosyltransferase
LLLACTKTWFVRNDIYLPADQLVIASAGTGENRILSDAPGNLHIGAGLHQTSSRPLGIFAARRLQAYGYALVAIYAVFFATAFRAGGWIIDNAGLPIYTDFAVWWAGGIQALHGSPAAVYDPTEFYRIQAALFRLGEAVYLNCPYPPTFFLVLAPLALMPYRYAFITWDVVTLLGCVAVVYMIVRRLPAIALVLASPFTAWNFIAAQNGLLTASLLGLSLLLLERQPVLAGIFIGCLTYKPQYGILFPVALVASHQWRAVVSAGVAAALLAAASIALFGVDAWAAFPGGLVAQGKLSLAAGPGSDWSYLQTVYGLIRSLHGSARLAWLVQGFTTLATAVIVWIVWRSRVTYPLKAAILSASALLATPYAFAYDVAAIVVPAAFLATDQLRRGLLRGEQTMWMILFAASLAVLVALGDNVRGPTFGGTPVSLLAVIVLFGVILRRARRPTAFA